jgi:putative PIN family toxin of toxin-antitoxin system
MRVVVDTNLWVSYLIQPRSPVADQLDHLTRTQTILFSRSTLSEFAEVFIRPKYRRYIDAGEKVVTTQTLEICRDPRDNKCLELAVSGKADWILTGDADLLVLHPFRGIPLWRLRDFPW